MSKDVHLFRSTRIARGAHARGLAHPLGRHRGVEAIGARSPTPPLVPAHGLPHHEGGGRDLAYLSKRQELCAVGGSGEWCSRWAGGGRPCRNSRRWRRRLVCLRGLDESRTVQSCAATRSPGRCSAGADVGGAGRGGTHAGH
ncbi:hypothetical protein QJS66_13870 [Kocuria rhizophila]|nr:hypothetical protein QJS66_13870 [Kocuria rhizophila]